MNKRRLKTILRRVLIKESTGVANEQRYINEIEMMLDDYQMGQGFEFDTSDRQEYEEFKAVLDFHFPQYKNVYIEDEDYDPEFGTVYILTMY